MALKRMLLPALMIASTTAVLMSHVNEDEHKSMVAEVSNLTSQIENLRQENMELKLRVQLKDLQAEVAGLRRENSMLQRKGKETTGDKYHQRRLIWAGTWKHSPVEPDYPDGYKIVVTVVNDRVVIDDPVYKRQVEGDNGEGVIHMDDDGKVHYYAQTGDFYTHNEINWVGTLKGEHYEAQWTREE